LGVKNEELGVNEGRREIIDEKFGDFRRRLYFCSKNIMIWKRWQQ
jgi:hypothetical protein